LISLRLYILLEKKYVILETFFQPITQYRTDDIKPNIMLSLINLRYTLHCGKPAANKKAGRSVYKLKSELS